MSINGKYVGLSPTAKVDVPPGEVEIKLENKLLGERVKKVSIQDGETKVITVEW